MDRITRSQRVKRPGSAIAGASGSEAKKRSREKVHVLDDVLLEALKSLSCPKWSKMRLVSRHLNGLVGRNVSHLPMVIFNKVEMRLKEREKTGVKMIVSDFIIFPDERDQWFKDRSLARDMPGNGQLSNAVIGLDLEENSCVDLVVLGPAEKKRLTPYQRTRPWFFGQQFKTEILFYAEFSPYRNKYSWASFSFFLKLLYDPSTYVKDLSMYSIKKKLNDILFANEETRFIRCGSFTLQETPDASVEELCESVSWLEQNILADIIHFPNGIRSHNMDYKDGNICNAMSNFLLGSSWTSASQEVKLGKINDAEHFFGMLIQKFLSIADERIFPTIVFCVNRPLRCDSLNNQLSGKWIVKEKLEDLKRESNNLRSGDKRFCKRSYGNEIYTISNKLNKIIIYIILIY